VSTTDEPFHSAASARRRLTFGEDFKRFFLKGLAALLPTLITLAILVKVWEFLWEVLGQHLINAIKWTWRTLSNNGLLPPQPVGHIDQYFSEMANWKVQLMGVLLAVVLVYIVGLLVGNLIGRTLWRFIEMAVLRIPIVRAVYPAVKQVTDFVLAERRG
jgi:uncharacterized membrane protein